MREAVFIGETLTFAKAIFKGNRTSFHLEGSVFDGDRVSFLGGNVGLQACAFHRYRVCLTFHGLPRRVLCGKRWIFAR
jgi:hypothetical protein